MKWIKTFESFESVDLSNPSKILFGEIKLGSQAAEEYLGENPDLTGVIISEIKKQTPESQTELKKFTNDFKGRQVEIRHIEESNDIQSIISQLLQKIDLDSSLINVLVSYVKTIQSIFSGSGFLFIIGVTIGCLLISFSSIERDSSLSDF